MAARAPHEDGYIGSETPSAPDRLRREVEHERRLASMREEMIKAEYETRMFELSERIPKQEERPPRIGDVVLFAIPCGPMRGETRPATIVRFMGGTSRALLAVIVSPADGFKRCPEFIEAEQGERLGEWTR